jgi:Cd2+/Zn2+-exporting ATPase
MTKKQKKVLYRIIIAFILMVVLHFIPVTGIAALLLYLIPYLIIGYDILKKAVLGILHGEVFDENFLMAVATVGAIALGEYAEGVAVMLFYQVGELFQSYAVGKSRKNIASLMDIRPDYANLSMGDTYEKVDPNDVAIGSVIVVLPGEKIPIDGVVVEGTTTLNTSALTGESVPRTVSVGEDVISGSVNLTGLLKVQTTKEFGESTVSKILNLVESSSMKKAKTEKFITKFAHYYTPAVCYSALALAVLPPLISMFALHQSPAWQSWIFRALTFLVISCPCALVISIPMSFFGGIGGASKNGILIKGSNYLEALAKTKYVVFDKTGTLTKGSFTVTEVVPTEGHSREELLELAAYTESYSTHPIAKSIRDAYGKELDSTLVTDVQEVGGHGVCATYGGKQILAGNQKLMDQYQISYVPTTSVGTIVYLAQDGVFLGSIVIADTVKETAAEAISGLKAAGVQKTIMLTGDNEAVAKDVAGKLGLDEYHAKLLPADKVALVEQFLAEKKENEVLAFVGDGINDAPVLGRADVGIAMGALGSDAAIEAADVVLMDDDPKKIETAMNISKKCLAIVYQNIVFALTIKALCLILTVFGITNMWMGIFADVGVMILAVLNAMRALSAK